MSNGYNAQRVVLNLLDRIDEAYPESRKQAVRDRMTDFFGGMMPTDRYPYVVCVGAPDAPSIPAEVGPYDRELITQLHNLLYRAPYGDDSYPALSPGVVQSVIPSVFGCTERFAENSVSVVPVIKDPEDVYKLAPTGFIPGTAGYQMLDKIRCWRERTEGRISFFEADQQGPFSVASQVWGIEDFLLATYDSPDEVKHLLGLCTDAIVEYIGLMTGAVQGDIIPLHCHPYTFFPKDKGWAISEDLAVVVSPAIVEEFMNPSIERLAREYGGIILHSCGSFINVIPALNRINGLIGLNFSSCETDLPRLASEFRRDAVLLVHNSPVATGNLPVLLPMEHARHCADVFNSHKRSGTIFIMNLDNSLTPTCAAALASAAAVR